MTRMAWQEQGERVLAGVRFDVYALELARRGGGSSRREVVVPADAVVVVPMLDDGRVALIRNERFAVGRSLLELPAGTLEEGEEPAACAARELTEETGYVAARVEALTSFYTSPGFCTERMHAYVATGLRFEGQSLDETERIEVEPMALDAALRAVREGEVEDAKTIAALLFYAQFEREN
ncbi:MAG: NUDIX hydrolase [Phycisphaeraceae bacterium]